MRLWKVAPSLFALSLLTTPCLAAEPAPSGATQPAVAAVDAGSIQALKDMGASLLKLSRFQVKTIVTGESVLEDGQKLQRSASAELQVQRPTRLRALMSSAQGERELIYDGKTVTLYTPALKYYASTEAADTIGGMIRQLEEKYGIDVPLVDLFIWGTDAAPLDKILSAMYAGQDLVGQELCDHYAFRQPGIDWQIWIATGDMPLPRKLVITSRDDEARPQSTSLLSWNLKPTFKDAVFTFKPPKDANRISIRPLSAK
jgi:hypothetical protein